MVAQRMPVRAIQARFIAIAAYKDRPLRQTRATFTSSVCAHDFARQYRRPREPCVRSAA
jgi:hypothetical protein